jgi:hypothetical protein
MWPISNLLYPTMLDRVPMDVIDMAVEIFLIPYHMLPKSALPHTSFSSFLSAFGDSLIPFDGT